MKKLIIICLICLFLISCASSMKIDNYKYTPYGLFNKNNEVSNIEYKVVWGNVVWSLVLFQTLIVPIYLVGFELMEPIGKKIDYCERNM